MNTPTWRNQKIANQADSDVLNQAALTHGTTPAYNQYKRRQHEQAAAHHHYLAIEFQKLGKPKESARHRMMYEAHCGAIGKHGDYQLKTPLVKLKDQPEVFTHHQADKLI